MVNARETIEHLFALRFIRFLNFSFLAAQPRLSSRLFDHLKAIFAYLIMQKMAVEQRPRNND